KMSAMQERLFLNMKSGHLVVTGKDGTLATRGLNNFLMQRRKICNHPYLFLDSSTWATNDDIWRCSGKLELLDRILPKLKATGHRILLFTQMTRMLDILAQYLTLKNIQFLRLDGKTKADDRGELLAKFNAPNSPYFIFILSTRAGGLGLNLQTADT